MSFVAEPIGLCNCGAKAVTRLAEVRSTRDGLLERGPFSDYGKADVRDGRTLWDSATLFGGFQFERWIETCGACFYGHAQRSHTPAPEHVAAAWRWLIRQWGGVSIFDDETTEASQVDAHLELCNRQAHHSKNPEAIPPKCWLDHVWQCTRDEAIAEFVR